MKIFMGLIQSIYLILQNEVTYMILFIWILILFTLLRLRKADNENRYYMSIEMTNSIKGFFLCLVFFSHIWTYVEFSHPTFDAPYMFFRKLGQCIVVMFMFYSGYGVMESVKKKGSSYVNGIPVQRFLKVLLQFDSAIVLFLIYRLFTNVHYDTKKILLAFVGWDAIGNSNWYIFCVLWLYVFTFISFFVFKEDHLKAILGVLLLSLLYMTIMSRLGREHWWYDTALCYTWGMLFSVYRKKIETFINKDFGSWLFFLVISSISYLTVYFYRNNNPALYQLWVICFAATIVIFTMRFVIDSKFLQWLGRNLFPLYILQRLPMLIFHVNSYEGKNIYLCNWLYVIICFATTLIIAVIYRETIGRIIGRLIAMLSDKTLRKSS